MDIRSIKLQAYQKSNRDVDPVTALKGKSYSLKPSYDLSIISQDSSKEQQTSDNGKLKIKDQADTEAKKVISNASARHQDRTQGWGWGWGCA